MYMPNIFNLTNCCIYVNLLKMLTQIYYNYLLFMFICDYTFIDSNYISSIPLMAFILEITLVKIKIYNKYQTSTAIKSINVNVHYIDAVYMDLRILPKKKQILRNTDMFDRILSPRMFNRHMRITGIRISISRCREYVDNYKSVNLK